MVSLKPGEYRVSVAVPPGFRPITDAEGATRSWAYVPDGPFQGADGLLTLHLSRASGSPEEMLDQVRTRADDDRLLHAGASIVKLRNGRAVFSRDFLVDENRILIEHVEAVVYHQSGIVFRLVLVLSDLAAFDDAVVDLAGIANAVELDVGLGA